MIDFSKYLGEYVVLITNSVDSLDEISGIRINDSTVFRYKEKWVLARPLTSDDIKDEDYVQSLDNIWGHNESNLKSFLKHKREHRNESKTNEVVTKSS